MLNPKFDAFLRRVFAKFTHKFDERILILRAWICDYASRGEARLFGGISHFCAILALRRSVRQVACGGVWLLNSARKLSILSEVGIWFC